MEKTYPFPAGPIVDGTGKPTLPGKGYLVGIQEIAALVDAVSGLTERSEDPVNPAEGHSIIWQSDGTDAGDDGDILIKITAGGVTKTATLVDFSAI
jgi:hypothetical protein